MDYDKITETTMHKLSDERLAALCRNVPFSNDEGYDALKSAVRSAYQKGVSDALFQVCDSLIDAETATATARDLLVLLREELAALVETTDAPPADEIHAIIYRRELIAALLRGVAAAIQETSAIV